ncbi:MAG: hypothetical protein JSS14_21885 [Proteobacteria bacterium]|nr:hypothetical protein [Pseudomonadota bacterium]
MDEENAPDTPLDFVRNATAQLKNQKAWALAKADSVEQRITAVGGDVPAELAEAIGELRQEAA